MNGRFSDNLEQAVNKYPALKQTLNLAKEFDVKIVRHYAKLTKRGKVSQHLFLVREKDGKEEWETNNTLLNWLRQCKATQKLHNSVYGSN
jgi:hypothetical protein